mgnify:CR=1 FL=1
MTIKSLSTIIAAYALLTGVTTNAATTYFSSNFDDTVVTDLGGSIGFGAQITAGNLNAGTATGTWTVDQSQAAPSNKSHKMIQPNGGGEDVSNKALRLGINTDGTMGANNPVVTANLTSSLTLSNPISVSFDYGIVSFDGNDRTTYMTGIDSSGNKLFQVGFVNSIGLKQVGYFDSNDTWTLIGSANDLIGDTNTHWNASSMKNVAIEIGVSTYDIKLGGASMTNGSGLGFRDLDASGLSKLQLSASIKWTGGAFDNIVVTQVPEPNSLALIGLGLMSLFRRRR